jgi:hypothetical protein
MSPSRAMQENSATDFANWVTIFDEEWVTREKWEYYLAEIRFALHRIWVAALHDPPKELLERTLEDFYCKFTVTSTSVKRTLSPTDAKTDVTLQTNKIAVMWAVGLNPDGSKPEGRKTAPAKKVPDQKG